MAIKQAEKTDDNSSISGSNSVNEWFIANNSAESIEIEVSSDRVLVIPPKSKITQPQFNDIRITKAIVSRINQLGLRHNIKL